MQIVNGSGTPYTLTDHYDPVVMGTQSPSVVIPRAQRGARKIIRARLVVSLEAVTLSGPATIIAGLRRTSDTPADLANSMTAVNVGVIGTSGQGEADIVIDLPPTPFTVTNGAPDTIKLCACVRAGAAVGTSGSGTSGMTEISDGALLVREATIMVEAV